MYIIFVFVDLIFFIFSVFQNVLVREIEVRVNVFVVWMYVVVGGVLLYNIVLVVIIGLKYVLNKFSFYRIDGSVLGLGVNCFIWVYYVQ